MLKIAVCDDDEKSINSMKFILRYFVNEMIDVDIFRSGRDLMKRIDNQEDYNIILLDIDMPGITGFDIARKVYSKSYGDNLIFVSNMENLVYESLEFRPFRFVRKKFLEEELPKAIRAWLDMYGESSHLEIIFNDIAFRIRISDIVYIEVNGHALYIHTTENVYKVRKRMIDFEYLIDTSSFIRIHNSYLCNMMFIKSIESCRCILYNGQELRIAQKRLADCKKEYWKFVRTR